MLWIVLTIAVGLILWFVLGFTRVGKSTVWAKNKKQWLALCSLVLLLCGCIVSVPTGHTGILTTFGKVEDHTLEAGLHFKWPVQQVVSIDNRTQKAVVDLSAFSSDIQEVSVSYSINYQIDKGNAQNIYKTIGANYYDVVMAPRIQVAVKSVIAKYTAESLVERRDTLSAEITDILWEELDMYNIEIVNTALENLDFSDAFTAAVEAKQVAQQNKLKAEIEQNQKNMEQEAAAERQKVAAQAEAEVAKIAAEADREVLQIQADAAEYAGKKDAAVNEALANSLTDILIRYYTIKQWDGKLPAYYVTGTDTVLPILGSLDTVAAGTDGTEETDAGN